MCEKKGTTDKVKEFEFCIVFAMQKYDWLKLNCVASVYDG